MTFLLFQLSGCMQAWGTACPGEVRNTDDHPSKSGLIGMISGCMGIDFRDYEKLSQVFHDLGYSCRIDINGKTMEDFHMVNHESRQKYVTLPSGILSYRYYLNDSLFTVCLWNWDPAQLKDIVGFLKQPKFTAYLGRSNCFSNLPFNPQIIEAIDLKTAYSQYTSDPGNFIGVKKDPHPRVFWEGEDKSIPKYYNHFRYDCPKSRKARTFGRRLEYEGRL